MCSNFPFTGRLTFTPSRIAEPGAEWAELQDLCVHVFSPWIFNQSYSATTIATTNTIITITTTHTTTFTNITPTTNTTISNNTVTSALESTDRSLCPKPMQISWASFTEWERRIWEHLSFYCGELSHSIANCRARWRASFTPTSAERTPASTHKTQVHCKLRLST